MAQAGPSRPRRQLDVSDDDVPNGHSQSSPCQPSTQRQSQRKKITLDNIFERQNPEERRLQRLGYRDLQVEADGALRSPGLARANGRYASECEYVEP